nr:HEAT repeat domain-containing protein [Planctomycetota bacterium]
AAQRRAALQMISMHGAPQFLKLALTALDDSDVLVRKAAIEVFVRHYHEAAADGLLRALRDEHKENRDLAKQALDAMRHIQEQEQHWKAWRLARQQPSVSAALLAQTKDSEPMEVRLAALRSIGLLGDVEALPFLIDAMKSEDAQIREAAKEAVATLQAIAAKRTK